MITLIKEAASKVAAFKATGNVTKQDYESVVLPRVEEVLKQTGELNYLMLIDTELSDFSAGAWMKDILLGFKKLGKWHKAAILTEHGTLNKMTTLFSAIAPGEFKGFEKGELEEALEWVAN